MYYIEYTIIENSKSKGLKKGITIIFSLILLIVMGISNESFFADNPTLSIFGSMVFMIIFVVFYFGFKTYDIVGLIRLSPDIVSIIIKPKSLKIKIEEIRYFDFEYKGYAGSYYPGDVVGGTMVSHDGTGNILEIATNTDIYKLNCLIEDERSAIALKNYIIKFNKSKLNKNE